MTLSQLMSWIAQTPSSIALHESLYLYSLIETLHVAAIALFAGSIIMVDLRLLGYAFPDSPVSQLTSRILPWTLLGFAIMALTGLLLFFAIPVRSFHNIWFRAKLALMVIAALNAVLFHWRVQRDLQRWDNMCTPPASARVSAAVSLTAWAGVIVTGRMMAYDWLDCGKVQAAWIQWLAQCPQ